MNPIPLRVYREQSYSLSSEEPSPTTRSNRRASEPFRFKRKVLDHPATPEKLAPPKKAKMAKEMQDLFQQQNSHMREILDEKINPITETLDELKASNKDIKESHRELGEKFVELGARLQELRDDVEKQKESLIEDIKVDLREEFKDIGLDSHHANLLREIDRTSGNLIVHGLKTKDPKREFTSLINDAIKDADIEVKTARFLGKEGKTAIISLGNEFQRNSVLKNSRLFPEGVVVDKDVPGPYRNKYSAMKKEAWRHRSFFGVKTQISFSGHILTLKYKEDGKGFVILSEFTPSPKECVTQAKASADYNLPPSTIINDEARENAHKVIIINSRGKNADEIKESLGMILDKSDVGIIDSTIVVNRNAKVTCKTSAQAKRISNHINGKTAGTFEFKTSLFSGQN